MSDLLFKKLSANLDKVLDKKNKPKGPKGPIMSKNSDYRNSKAIFNIGNDVATGIIIILGTVILFLLFRELLDYYGTKKVTYDTERPVSIEKFQDSTTTTTGETTTTTTKYHYKVPNPKPVSEHDTYYSEQQTIKDIGVVRNVKSNKEYVFSNQLALDDSDVNSIVESTKTTIKNTPITFTIDNFNTQYKQKKLTTIHNFCKLLFQKVMEIVNDNVTKLGLHSEYHGTIDYQLLDYRIVNTLEEDKADYNKVWIVENNKPVQLHKSKVKYVEKKDSDGKIYYMGIRKKGSHDEEKDNLTDEDILIIQSNKHKHLIDFNLKRNEFHFRIGKDLKYQTFTLYLDIGIVRDSTGNKFTIKANEMVLIGTRNQYGLLANGTDGIKGNFSQLNNDQSTIKNIAKNKKNYDVFNENDIPSNYFDDKFKSNELDKKAYQYAMDDDEKKMACFGVDANNKNIELKQYSNKMYCESYHTDINQVGIWDGPCQKNEECPFYKTNKNYDNEFGGCQNGVCEMPLGINRIGFTKYSDTKPLCYNCPIGTYSKCCQQQHLDSLKDNAKILSPDLVFLNDCETNGKYRKSSDNEITLKNKKLKVCPSL
jgi:hypothetical protein